MSEAFDPYHRWLGIAPKDQPAHHYRLLGIDLYETDKEVIRDAAERQMAHVRKYQLGQNSAISQKMLNEIAAAKSCLIDPSKKTAYDGSLKLTLNSTPSPMPSPAIQNNSSVLSRAGTKVEKTSVFVKILDHPWYIQWMPRYIGLYVAIILGVIIITIFVIRNNNGDSKTPKSNDQIAQVTDSTKQNTPDQPLAKETPDVEKTLMPIITERSDTKSPTDNIGTSTDNQGTSEEGAGGDQSAATYKTKEESIGEVAESSPNIIPEVPPPEKRQEPQTPGEKTITASEPPPKKPITDTSSPENRLQQVVEHMVSAFNEKDYRDMRKDFAPGMEVEWPIYVSAKIFRSLMTNRGKITHWDSLNIIKKDIPSGKNILPVKYQVKFTAYFDRGTVDFKIWFDDQYQITYVWMDDFKKSVSAGDKN